MSSSVGSILRRSYSYRGVIPCRKFTTQAVMEEAKIGIFPVSTHVGDQGWQTYSWPTYARGGAGGNLFMRNAANPRNGAFLPGFTAINHLRAYSSDAKGRTGGDVQTVDSNVSSGENSGVHAAGVDGSSWMDMLDRARQTTLEATTASSTKIKELSDVVTPHIQHFYEKYPHLEKVIVPMSGTLFGTAVAWFVMPVILRRLHKYSTNSPLTTAILGPAGKKEVPYENSVWSAAEDPVKYLITFMAFSQMAAIIAPSIADFLPQAWRGATVLSFVWFLHRWKTNFVASVMANQVTVGIDRDKLAAFDRASSLGLMALGAMALAEAFGVPVQSLLTVGGVGGVATAFAARDILGNMLSGFALQFTRPFTVGDTIKAGSIEGQVVEIGLTTTSLINPEKLPVIAPNSLFSSQIIVNKSRAQWRACVTKIPVRIKDIEKIPAISEEIKAMLISNQKVFLEKDAPYCYLSRLESSFGELTIGCNLKSMRKDEWYAAEQDILIQAAKIIKQHGAELGSTM